MAVTQSWRASAVTVLCACVLVFCATRAYPSQLLAPALGVADTSINGAAVAETLSATGAMFSNPAALVNFSQPRVETGLGLLLGHAEISSPAPYEEEHEPLGIMPSLGLALGGEGPAYWGLAMYGSVGVNNDFDGDPSFFSEVSIMSLAPTFAYRVSEDLSVGASLTPLFGLVRVITTADPEPFHYRLTGPGIQAMVGVSWKAGERSRLGIGLRTPGIIWLRGSDVAQSAGDARQEVKLDLEMPAQVFVGLNHHASDRTMWAASLRWTDTSKFSGSTLRYELTPAGNMPFITDARDEWRLAVGMDHLIGERLRLRWGASYASSIIGNRGISPLNIDGEDIKLGGGLGWDFGDWLIDVMAGFSPEADRNIPAADALVFPGRYRTRGVITMLGLTRLL